MQLFISHSSKDREWVELVSKRIEAGGFSAYLAEYDLSGVGGELTPKIQTAIEGSAAVVVVLTENAAGSPIVRDEIGFALGRGKPVIPLVTPGVAQSAAALGMLNGREYIPFDIKDAHEGLIKLTDWVNSFAMAIQKQVHESQLAAQQAQLREQAKRLAEFEATMASIQLQNDTATMLLVFVGAIAIAAIVVAANS
jgi:hypothetical protein